MLAGGGKLNTAFLQRGLVNEIWLIICPYIIGQGRPVIAPAPLDVPLQFIECRELSAGRILVQYTVESKK